MPTVRIAIVSVPSGSVTTLGRFSIAPTPRIATWGWLMIGAPAYDPRSEEHTSELQSHSDLVCRLLLEKKKDKKTKQQYLMLPLAHTLLEKPPQVHPTITKS